MPVAAQINLDALFRDAVASIDAGDASALRQRLDAHPELACTRLEQAGAWLRDTVGKALDPGEFFERPYLLWFVAEDPARNNRLPPNIAEITGVIVDVARRTCTPSQLKEMLDYAIRLVAWSWIAPKFGVQIPLIDVLVDAGASPAVDTDALVNRHRDAAAHLVKRGAPLSLATALCLSRWDDAERFVTNATKRDKQVALVLAALNGNAEALARLIRLGVDLNAYSTEIYTHATSLHHAVCSGSLDAVRTLVEAGADLTIRDTAWHATPLGWAQYYLTRHQADDRTPHYAAIAAYLRERGALA